MATTTGSRGSRKLPLEGILEALFVLLCETLTGQQFLNYETMTCLGLFLFRSGGHGRESSQDFGNKIIHILIDPAEHLDVLFHEDHCAFRVG